MPGLVSTAADERNEQGVLVMVVKQKGFSVRFNRLIGRMVFLFSLLWIFFLILSFIFSGVNLDNVLDWILLFFGIFIHLLIVYCLVLVGSFFAGMFPDLYVTQTGIICKYLVFHLEINWQDIYQIVETKELGKVRAILLKRKGLILNLLYGSFWTKVWNKPAVLVRLDSENINQLDQLIFQNLGLHLVESVQ